MDATRYREAIALGGRRLIDSQETAWQGFNFELWRSPPTGITGVGEEFRGYWLAVNLSGGVDTVLTAGRVSSQLHFSAGAIACYPPGSHWDKMEHVGVVEAMVIPLTLDALGAISRDPHADMEVLREVCTMPCMKDPPLTAIATNIITETRSGCMSGRLYAESLSLALIGRLVGLTREIRSNQPRLFGRLGNIEVHRLVEYIESCLSDDLSVAALAQLAGIPVSTFASAFKSTFGKSVHRYVMQRRIEKSIVLLKIGGSDLAQVALDCGFSNQSHFTEAFRRSVGDTPGNFRRSCRSWH